MSYDTKILYSKIELLIYLDSDNVTYYTTIFLMAMMNTRHIFWLQQVIVIIPYFLGGCGGITWGSWNYAECNVTNNPQNFCK